MSRAFSSTARNLKTLLWSHNGTTKDVEWAKYYAENAVDYVPKLLKEVDSATVQGDPHDTPKTKDPYHVSITLMNGNKRVTSAHVYPNGRVAFSSSKIDDVNIPRISEAPEGDGPSSTAK